MNTKKSLHLVTTEPESTPPIDSIYNFGLSIIASLPWLIVAFTLFVITGVGILYAADSVGEMRRSQVLLEAQRKTDAAQQKDIAAAKACRLAYGESTMTRAESGDWVCVPKGYRK